MELWPWIFLSKAPLGHFHTCRVIDICRVCGHMSASPDILRNSGRQYADVKQIRHHTAPVQSISANKTKDKERDGWTKDQCVDVICRAQDAAGYKTKKNSPTMSVCFTFWLYVWDSGCWRSWKGESDLNKLETFRSGTGVWTSAMWLNWLDKLIFLH